MCYHQMKACHCHCHHQINYRQNARQKAGAQSRPAQLPYDPSESRIVGNAMGSRTVGSAIRCCKASSSRPPKLILDKTCRGTPHPFKEELAGTCDIGFTFRADVDLCEEFFPRPVPTYPAYTEPPCEGACLFADEEEPFMIDKASGVTPPPTYNPCFEHWVESGYQRER